MDIFLPDALNLLSTNQPASKALRILIRSIAILAPFRRNVAADLKQRLLTIHHHSQTLCMRWVLEVEIVW